MMQTRPRLQALLPLFAVVAACSDYWGPGPDPSRAGPANVSFSGSSGSGGAQNAGGDGNSNSCDTAPLDLLLEQVNANCADVRSCARANCDPEVQQCLGNNYQRGDVGGPCQSYVTCATGCGCNESCVNGCNNVGGDACAMCLSDFVECMQGACVEPYVACQAASGKPTVLTANLNSNVSVLAVDADALYFATNNGIASIPKAGGVAKALGGFSNLNGLAVGGGFIYVVIDSGAVSRMKTDGSQPMTLISSTFGGGSGPILLDGTQLFYMVGPYVRRGPSAGGTPTNMVNDVWQQGPNASQRLALDGSSVYYVGGGPMPGSASHLNSVKKDAQIADGGDTPGNHAGTSLATANGEIRGVVSDGKQIYFADLASDGLKMMLQIRKVEPSTGRVTQLAAVAPLQNGGGATPLATDGVQVYVAGSAGLISISTADGKAATLVANTQPSAIALDDEYVYWAEQSSGGLLKRLHK